jgi:hypothetical protein
LDFSNTFSDGVGTGGVAIVTLESLLDQIGCVADNQGITEAEQQDENPVCMKLSSMRFGMGLPRIASKIMNSN